MLPSTAYVLVDTAARGAELLRRIQTRESGVPGLVKRLSAEAKAFRNPLQPIATPQVARSEERSIRRFKTSKRPNRRRMPRLRAL